MKIRFLTTLTLLLAVSTAPAQERERFYSDPAIPPREVLARLNLEIAWRTDLPMEGRRDGIVSVQHTGRQILVQTRGGIVALFDAETGRRVWRVRVGDPFNVAFPPSFNSTSVFAVNGNNLYALDRSNGSALWELSLRGGLAAPPIADEDQVYLFTGSGSVFAYHPTAVEVPESLASPGSAPKYGSLYPSPGSKEERVVQVVRPLPRWDAVTRMHLDLPAVQSVDTLVVADARGEVLGLRKYPGDGFLPEAYRFPLESKLRASPGVLGTIAYFPGRDGFVYAFDITTARVRWRQLIGSTPLTRTPVVTEQDVFVVSDREGMSRLDRDTGTPLWRIPVGNDTVNSQRQADRFLAASPKYVYALDKSGGLLVLDRARGFLLSRLDVRDYVVPVVNDQTDRLYLAANNGLLLCLRDRDYPEPQRNRKISEKEAEAGKTPEERSKELRERLSKPMDFEAGEPIPFPRFLEDLRRNYGIKSFVSEEAYRKEVVRLPNDAMVKIPKKDKTPLGEVIQDVLGQVNSTYSQLGEMIFIIPKKGAPMPLKP